MRKQAEGLEIGFRDFYGCSISTFATMSAISRSRLFYYLVGAAQQRWRHCEPKDFCCLQVDCKFKSGWLLYREVTWLGSFEGF